jgi:hypothetical protein
MKKRKKEGTPETLTPSVAAHLLSSIQGHREADAHEIHWATHSRVQLELISGRGPEHKAEDWRQCLLNEKIMRRQATPEEIEEHEAWLREKWERHEREVREDVAKGLNPWTREPRLPS